MVNHSYIIVSIVYLYRQEPLHLDTFCLYGLIYVYVFLLCVHNGFVYVYNIVCMFILCIHVCHSPCWEEIKNTYLLFIKHINEESAK